MSFKIIPYLEAKPLIADDAYVADGCMIIGDVVIGSKSSIWFNSVLRGDVAAIKIGNNTNIQDGTVIHTSRFNDGQVRIGNNVTIGHMALIHACRIQDNSFVGMRATIMDNAIIEQYGFVAAGALITPNKIVKSRELWAGIPAKFIRYITDSEIQEMQDTNENYVELANLYLLFT